MHTRTGCTFEAHEVGTHSVMPYDGRMAQPYAARICAAASGSSGPAALAISRSGVDAPAGAPPPPAAARPSWKVASSDACSVGPA